MANKRSTISMTVPVGTKMKIVVPVINVPGSDPSGSWPNPGPMKLTEDGSNIDLINGFYLENPLVGTITALNDKVGVWYEHKKPLPNRIFFYSISNDVAIVNIVTIPVHTHQSIVHGGPAYGTYSNERPKKS